MEDVSKFDLDISHGETSLSPHKESKNKKDQTVAWFFIGSAGQIGFAIIIPLLVGIALGIAFDNRFNTKPSGVLSGLGLGLLLSILSLVRTVKEIINSSSHQ